MVTVRRVVPDLDCADLGAARAFYTGVLGMKVAMDLGSVVTLRSPGEPVAQVTLQEPGGPDVTVEVDDVDAAYAAARRLGYEVVRPLTDEPWGVRRFFVRDPAGTVVNVLSHR